MTITFKKITKEKNYIDVTNNWLNNAIPNSHEIAIDNYFITNDGIMHPIKGKEKVSIPIEDSDEYKMAEILKNIFGGNIHLVPRIETEKGYKGLVKVPTPDYRWNNQTWDLKTPGTSGEFKTSLERFLKKKGAKEQSRKIIIDYKNFPDKSIEEITKVIKETLNNRNWVEDIIVMRGKELIKIYSKKK